MNAFDRQLLRDAITYDDLKPIHLLPAPRGGAGCRGRGCEVAIPAGGVLVWSKAWPAVEACCCVDCLLSAIQDGSAEAPMDWAADASRELTELPT